MKQVLTFAALCSFAFTSLGGTVEWPIYMGSNIKDARGERVIIGNILTGTLPDGSPAVRRVNETSVRYFESDAATGGYFTYELNCRTGEGRVFSFGTLAQQKVLPDRNTFNINDQRAELLPAYREVCMQGGIAPKAGDEVVPDKAKNQKKRSTM